MIRVTTHAAERYIERIAPHITHDEALSAIAAHERAIEQAAAFGCDVVKLGNRARLVLQGTTVVTVVHGRVGRWCNPGVRDAKAMAYQGFGK